ncbi:MAG: hypothetical protein ACKVTZ_00315, partial [Bacteroidia bacterium]
VGKSTEYDTLGNVKKIINHDIYPFCWTQALKVAKKYDFISPYPPLHLHNGAWLISGRIKNGGIYHYYLWIDTQTGKVIKFERSKPDD